MSTLETTKSLLENPIQKQPPEVVTLPNGDMLAIVTRKATYNLSRQTTLEIAKSSLSKAINAIKATGATPCVVNAYWGVGESSWFADITQISMLVSCWKEICDAKGITWGAGETQTLPGIIKPGKILIHTTCIGILKQTSLPYHPEL